MTRLSTLLLGLAIAVFFSNVAGVVAGALLAALGPLVIERLESGSTRNHRVQYETALPTLAMTLAVSLRAGLTLTRALEISAIGVPDVIREDLERTVRAMQRGGHAQAFLDLGQRIPAWQSMTIPIARAIDIGSPLSAVLQDLAIEEARNHHDRVMIAARRLGVKATIPVALFLLPAFVFLGVVPLVFSLAHTLIPSL